jgi:hypothetical protein
MKHTVRRKVVTVVAAAAFGVAGAVAVSAAAMASGNPNGDPSQPQPLSNADTNSGGANGQCPDGTYCSTRDGSPSQNGVGDGQANGKPCAGCVGSADNKNPPGQEKQDPLGTFPNNGYECDNNQGIGQSNPAHTGCVSPTVSPSANPSPGS